METFAYVCNGTLPPELRYLFNGKLGAVIEQLANSGEPITRDADRISIKASWCGVVEPG